MHKIIISYRRSDSAWTARSIFDRLAAHYGKDSVFMDIDSIPFGTDFRDHINAALSESAVLIALIGPQWIGPREGGPARINDDNDPVRIEIEAALRCGTPIIPILVDGSRMPQPGELPASLAEFSFRNAAEVHAGRNFHQQIDQLLSSLDRLLEPKTAAASLPQGGAAVPSMTALTAGEKLAGSPMAKPVHRERKAHKSRGALFAGLALMFVLLLAGLALTQSRAGRDLSCSRLGVLCSEVAAIETPVVAPSSVPTIEMPNGGPVVRPQRPLRPQASAQNCAKPPAGLGITRYCASSVLPPQAGNNYGVQNLFNDDNTAAWIEGRPGQGIGEWILLEFERPWMVKSLMVSTGYQKNAEVFARNSRVSKLRLVFSEGEVQAYDLADRQGLQEIVLAPPVKSAEWVQVVIDGVFPGSRFTDTAISKLFVTLDRPQ